MRVVSRDAGGARRCRRNLFERIDELEPGAPLMRTSQPRRSTFPDDLIVGDLEIHNDAGSTQAMVQPSTGVRRKETFMLFAYPTGVQGNVVNAGTNELVIPNYKQTWGSIRKLAAAPAAVGQLSFKSWEYRAG